VHRPRIHPERPGRHVRIGEDLALNQKEKAARVAHQHSFSRRHEGAGVEADAIAHAGRPDGLDGGHQQGLVLADPLDMSEKLLQFGGITGGYHYPGHSRLQNAEGEVDLLA